MTIAEQAQRAPDEDRLQAGARSPSIGAADLAASRPQRIPSRVRLTLVLMLGVYPLINALLYLVLPLAPGWEIWQVTLVVVPMMVPIMVFGIIPLTQRLFGHFIMVPAKS